MDNRKNHQELFKIILEEILDGCSEKELGSMIDTFVEIYAERFGIRIEELEDTEPEETELMHTKEATEYLRKFTL